MVRIDASVTGWLMAVAREINAVLGDLSPADLPNQAINWGDLGCNDVTLRWDGDRLVILAVIEEAAPECSPLIAAVMAGLADRGYDPQRFEIVTEW